MKAERQSALKPKLWSILLLTALAIVAQGSLHAANNGWTNVGPEGGSFWQLAMDPQDPAIIYGLTGVGLFKSKDGGASWNNAGLNGLNVYALIIDPQQPAILYAVATNQAPLGGLSVNIFKSADGGTSWNALGSGLPSCCGVTLAIDPLNTGTLYAFRNYGLFKSTNAGASWSMIYSPPSGRSFYDIAIDPKTPGTLYAVAYGPDDVQTAVYKSVDGGTSWSEADAGLAGPGLPLTIDPTNPATIYTIGGGPRLYKTTDGAASWHAVDSAPPIQSLSMEGFYPSGVVIDPRDSNTLYLTFANTVFPRPPSILIKSTDGGASWNAYGLQFAPTALAIDPRNSSTIYAATSSGMYRSTDGGVSFTPYSRARALQVTSVALDPQRSGAVLAGGRGIDGADIFQSTDAGVSWVASGTNLGDAQVAALAIDPHNSRTVYAGIGVSDCVASKAILESVDGGTSWTASQSLIGCLTAIVMDSETAGTLYAGSNTGVSKSIDGGRTWTDMSSGLPDRPPAGSGPNIVDALAIDPRNTGTLFAGGAYGVFKSTDGGANWAAANSGIPAFPATVIALAVDPETPSTVYAAMAPAAGLWKSTDGGANWRNVFPATVYAVAINPRNPATIFAGTDNGLERSTDGGVNWTMIPGGPGRVSVLALDPQDPDTVYAGGEGGLFAIRVAPVLLGGKRKHDSTR